MHRAAFKGRSGHSWFRLRNLERADIDEPTQAGAVAMSMRPDYEIAVQELGIIDALAVYDPHIAGTPPLDIHTEASDIDILFCTLDHNGVDFH
ncbi:hypothetical protein ASE36_21175 [Rhizobium sp. Root274]|uniref:DUF4269 domain-containing protein n=1 Tax=unclassified Rhizobium TaxID=2613769 RepID=UPI0007133526|nr:DUF4269 domain-containing protein [Rhizobium sp. Root274]KQW25451.1 hypothetical protein ASC71_21235 [Rhizobium sp. Root1240]KRD26071.1 hypothetical protein ASE36_21175 [Rhizobium sp. Root274]